jgi:hypothetical protein
MQAEELIELLAERPFNPLRIHMSNGRTHEIRHPENAIVGEFHAALLVAHNGRELIRLISVPHINEVEPLPPQNGSKKSKPKTRKKRRVSK